MQGVRSIERQRAHSPRSNPSQGQSNCKTAGQSHPVNTLSTLESLPCACNRLTHSLQHRRPGSVAFQSGLVSLPANTALPAPKITDVPVNFVAARWSYCFLLKYPTGPNDPIPRLAHVAFYSGLWFTIGPILFSVQEFRRDESHRADSPRFLGLSNGRAVRLPPTLAPPLDPT